MIAQDILLDDDADLLIQDGDFVIGASDWQHINDILLAAPGHFKEFPLFGCNLWAYLNGNIPKQQIINNITVQLKSDGYAVNGIGFTYDESGNLIINKVDASRN